MKEKQSANEFDVIGSGMGGMTAAAALSRLNHKVLHLNRRKRLAG